MISIHKTWFKINNLKKDSFLKRNYPTLVLYPYSLSKNLIQEILIKLEDKIIITTQIKYANIIIGLKKNLRQNFRLIGLATNQNIPIYTINQKSIYQIMRLLYSLVS